MLTPEKIAFYQANGYILIERFISGNQLARLTAAVDKLVYHSRELDTESEGVDFEENHTFANPRPRRFSKSLCSDPIFDELKRDPRLVDAVSRLIGPNIRTTVPKISCDPTDKKEYGLKINIKWPQSGTPF